MKTMKTWVMSLLFVMAMGFTLAQTPDMPGFLRSEEMESLLQAGKVGEAIKLLETFKQEKTKEKADPFDVFLFEMQIYRDIANGLYPIKDGSDLNMYKTKYADYKKGILKKYPNRGDAYMMQILDGDATPEEVVKYASKVIELEPHRMDVYLIRAQAYRALGKEEEAAADEAKMMNWNN